MCWTKDLLSDPLEDKVKARLSRFIYYPEATSKSFKTLAKACKDFLEGVTKIIVSSAKLKWVISRHFQDTE
jgi:hypothetical protein